MPLFRRPLVCLNVGVILLFIVDRISKWLALRILPSEGSFLVPRITGFIVERNQGIAYGIPLPPVLLIMVTIFLVVLLVVLLVHAYRRHETAAVVALSLIIAGAFSNFLDRLHFGYVIDMVVLTGWPVFNLADVMILAGIIWLAIVFLRQKKIN